MKSTFKSTQCVHSGTKLDQATGGVNTPIYTSTAFDYLGKQDLLYPRYFNTPNQIAVIEKLCALEMAQDGLLFSSGMSAIVTALLAHLRQGDHAVFQRDIYGGTLYTVVNELPKFGIDYTLVDGTEPAAYEKAFRPNTKVIYIETPSNPLLRIVDVKAIARMAQRHGVLSFIDNTFASPINQNPLTLGIDVVLHSGTKYLGGHSDICCGAALGSTEVIKVMRNEGLRLGGSLNAQTCSLLERSLKTLALRVGRQNESAHQLANALQSHPAVNRVYYPGLETHPDHIIAKQQMTGFGGMLSFEVKPGIIPLDQFVRSLKLIQPALSLGGIESTICSPFNTSHAKVSAEERKAVGITDQLLRLSVGIEEYADLWEDIQQALTAK